MRAILDIILLVLELYIWVVVAGAVLSWLVAFGVVNVRNQMVNAIADAIHQLTSPALRPIQRRIPTLGNLDISPLVLILLILLVQRIIGYYIYPYVP